MESCRGHCSRCFVAMQGTLPGETAGAMLQLAQMFGLNTFHKQLGDFLEDGYMSGAPEF